MNACAVIISNALLFLKELIYSLKELIYSRAGRPKGGREAYYHGASRSRGPFKMMNSILRIELIN